MDDESAEAVLLQCPNDPEGKENHRHREGEIEIRVGAPEQRTINMKSVCHRVVMSPANSADPGNQSEPVEKQDEDENCGKKPEGLAHQMGADHALEEVVKPFHHPFPKVLHAVRHRLDFPGRHLSKDDYSCGHDPGYEHGVCHRKFSQRKKRLGLQRKRFVLFRRACRGRRQFGAIRGRHKTSESEQGKNAQQQRQ